MKKAWPDSSWARIEAIVAIVKVHAGSGNVEEARKSIQRIFDGDLFCTRVIAKGWAAIAVAQMKAGNMGLAWSTFESIPGTQERNEAYSEFVYRSLECNRFEEAIAAANRIRRKIDGNIIWAEGTERKSCLSSIAVGLAKFGKVDRAWQVFEMISDSGKVPTVVAYHISWAFVENGRPDFVRRWAEKTEEPLVRAILYLGAAFGTYHVAAEK